MTKYIDITFPYHSLADILESLSICGVKEVIMTNEDNKLKIRLNVDELSKLNYYKKNPKKEDEKTSERLNDSQNQASETNEDPFLTFKFKERLIKEHIELGDFLRFVPDDLMIRLIMKHKIHGNVFNEVVFVGAKRDYPKKYELKTACEIKRPDEIPTICFDD